MEKRAAKIALQELLASEGWVLFKSLVLEDRAEHHPLSSHLSLKSKIYRDMAAASRVGDGVRAARFAGQLDLLDVLLRLPENELKKLG